MLLAGWDEGHPTCKKSRFNTPYYKAGNRLTEISPGKWLLKCYECVCAYAYWIVQLLL